MLHNTCYLDKWQVFLRKTLLRKMLLRKMFFRKMLLRKIIVRKMLLRKIFFRKMLLRKILVRKMLLRKISGQSEVTLNMYTDIHCGTSKQNCDINKTGCNTNFLLSANECVEKQIASSNAQLAHTAFKFFSFCKETQLIRMVLYLELILDLLLDLFLDFQRFSLDLVQPLAGLDHLFLAFRYYSSRAFGTW